jgi:large subunit ribosomal protein L1
MKKGKKYMEALKKIEKDKVYSLDEALALLPQTSPTKFDATVEVHIRLGIDSKQGDQQVRGTVLLPHVFGKKKRIAVFANDHDQDKARQAGADVVGGEELVKEIKQKGKVDFDIALATPDMMKALSLIAKILGPKGLMPSPKSETVTTDIVKAIQELSKGNVPYKNDSSGNVHLAVGKVSMDKEVLRENVVAFLEAVKQAKPETVKGTYLLGMTLATTMGPSIRFRL